MYKLGDWAHTRQLGLLNLYNFLSFLKVLLLPNDRINNLSELVFEHPLVHLELILLEFDHLLLALEVFLQLSVNVRKRLLVTFLNFVSNLLKFILLVGYDMFMQLDALSYHLR